VLVLIGLTLIFTGATSTLGIPRAARAWRSRRAGPAALVTHLLMAAWFFAAGSVSDVCACLHCGNLRRKNFAPS
jgi:hypothetical protein